MKTILLVLAGASVGSLAACDRHVYPENSISATEERSGRAIAISDTMDMSDAPIRKGFVLFIPAVREAEFTRETDTGRMDEEAMRHASFVLHKPTLESFGGTPNRIGVEGVFPLTVRAGSYFVCLANIFPDHAAEPPYVAVGCARLAIADGHRTVNVMFGEAGVEVSAR